jgi:Ni,Fe-hydrogenase I large subunit
MTKTITIDPFNRLEGDLRVSIQVEDHQVIDAQSSAVMFRGFERIMAGRNPMDAIVITPRICGICSASHGVVSSKAIANALGTDKPANAYYMNNLILASEVAMSHLSHFYLLFSPDMTNKAYEKYGFYAEMLKRFRPMTGTSVVQAVKARQSMLEIMGLVAGKWPNTLAMQPSGTTSTMDLSSLTRAIGVLNEFKHFIEKRFLQCSISEWLDIDRYEKLDDWLNDHRTSSSDLGLFLSACFELRFDRLGAGPERFMSFGGYDLPSGKSWLPGGIFEERLQTIDQELIREHISSSFFRDAVESRHPLSGVTVPYADKDGAYSWAKAPRYDGYTVEVGPLARQIVAQEPLITDLYKKIGANVLTRMLARLHEMVKLINEMSNWIEKIDHHESFYEKASSIYKPEGIGLIEAARGGLGHWLTTTSNSIENYQVITPSAWNMSPRDSKGNLGPMEQALVNTIITEPDNPIEVNHIVRSFDPCMSCSVH